VNPSAASQRAALAGVRVEGGDRQPGCRDAEVGGQRRRHGSAMLDDPFARQGGGDIGQRQVGRDRHRTQAPAGQHHRRPAVPTGRLAQIFGQAGVSKARFVQHVLLHRVGDHRGGPPVADQTDGPVDRVHHRAGGCGVGMAGPHGDAQIDRQDRQGALEHAAGFGRLGHRTNGDIQPQCGRQPLESLRVVDGNVGRRVGAAGSPGLERQLAADAGRLAHGNGERLAEGGGHTLTSRKAARRRSRK
jgi:hypothetical protein